MNKVTIYHNPRCSNCRGACILLDENSPNYTLVNYLEKPLTEAKLKSLIKKLGIKPIELIRQNEEEFKKYKGKKLSDEKLITLMLTHPILIQRPIIEMGTKAIIARPPELLLDFI